MSSSDDEIQEILRQAAAEHLVPVDLSVVRMFDFVRSTSHPTHAVAMQRWVIAETHETDTIDVLRTIARMAVTEMRRTMTLVIGELVFGPSHMFPVTPVWLDASPLFATHGAIDGAPRFGVESGNVVESVGCLDADVEEAIDRLARINPGGLYDSDDHLMVLCARRNAKQFIRSFAAAGYRCKAIGLKDYEGSDWALIGSKSPCALEIRRPDYELPYRGSRIVVGAQFTTWIQDPRCAVLVRTMEIE